MNSSVLFVFAVMLLMCVFHLRSVDRCTPRYLCVCVGASV